MGAAKTRCGLSRYGRREEGTVRLDRRTRGKPRRAWKSAAASRLRRSRRAL